MKRLIITIFALCLLNPMICNGEQYQDGWNYKNFYNEVHKYRMQLTSESASQYIKKAIENNANISGDEIIITLPIYDRMFSSVSFCTINEIAKDYTYDQYSKGLVNPDEYIRVPKCKKLFSESIAKIDKIRKSLPSKKQAKDMQPLLDALQ